MKYSICVPVYKCEEYISKGIESLLSQSYFDIEVVLVDDKSPDNSYRVCEEYAKRDNRIKLYKNDKNLGVMLTEMRAISKTTGDFVLFMDCDDYYEPGAIEKIDNYIKKNPDLDLLMYGFKRVTEKETLFVLSEEEEKYSKHNREDFLLRVATKNDYSSWWQKAIRGSIVRSIEIPKYYEDISRGNDKLFSALLYEKTMNVMFVPDVLYNWRDNEKGITRSSNSKYTIEYRDKYAMRNLLFNDDSVSDKTKAYYNKYQLKQMNAQILRIANLNMSRERKINFYKEIKTQDFYINVIKDLLIKSDIKAELKMFLDGKYNTLIIFSILKTRLSNLLKPVK